MEKRSLAKKIPVCCLTAALAAGCIPAQAFAASSNETKIGTVNLEFDENWEKPKAGNSIEETLPVTTDTKGVAITDAYYTKDDDEWERGDKVTIKVTLEAEKGYYFYSPKLSRVNGLKSVDSKKIRKDEDEYSAVVTIELEKVSGDLEAPEYPEWDDTVAEWEDVDDAEYYSVRLSRDGKTVKTIQTDDTSFDFYQWMTRSGDYSFEVKARADKSSDDSAWSDESDELDISSGERYEGQMPSETDFRNGSKSTVSKPGNPQSGANQSPSYSNGWKLDKTGWKFYSASKQVFYSWVRDGLYWYYIGEDGYMKTGWQMVNGAWYYMDNETTKGLRPLGSMHTGWLNLNNVWYYLSDSGSMVTGYMSIGGSGYFFTESGALLMNGAAPDGRIAGADGILK